MEKTFCTIITRDYLPYALTLYNSIAGYNDRIDLNVLITDCKDFDEVENYKKVNVYGWKELCTDGVGERLKEKYQKVSMDRFRWSMKPVFINYLLKKRDYNKVIFVDPDIYFFNDYNFLFDELTHFNVLLNPHWRNVDPYVDQTNFHANFIDGFFNGGFIGANKNGIKAMDWWAMACEYACEKDPMKGLFDDQGYLNLLPIYFDNIGIIRHKGCNVASWNRLECKRVLQDDGSVLINGEDPVVFVHFHPKTIKTILRGNDPHLVHYLEEYVAALRRHNPGLDILSMYREQIERLNAERRGYFNFIKKSIKKRLPLFNS